jgi:molecular chaperone DnaK (HSP70)
VMQTRIHIPYITKNNGVPLDVDVNITREDLEKLCGDLVQRTVDTCSRIFKEAGTSITEVDEILLVGGQSRMPLVQSQITDFTGKPPSKGVHPDEAVAMGAAIMAHSLSSSSSNEVTLLDVLPMPIGINKVDGTMHVLFPKNQPLPDYKTRTLTTSKNNQRSIMLRLYQGESRMVAENERLGTFVFSNIRQAPKGQVQIEVTFHIDSEGILNLTARDKETSQTVDATLKLGKGDNRKRRKKPEVATSGSGTASSPEKAAEAPRTPPPIKPPTPFSMPTSSLAQSMASTSTPTADPPPVKDTTTGDSPAADTAATDTTAAESQQTMPDIRPSQRTDESVGLFARIMGWFKGLFGGK